MLHGYQNSQNCCDSVHIHIGLFVNIHDGVFAATEPDGFGVFDGMDAVLLVDAVKQIGGVVGGRHLLVVDDVNAGLV